jgi:hypothetical protein
VPFKPYLDYLVSPAGINVLRDAPHDHLHHHGVMLAMRVEGIDFWVERPGAGSRVDRGLSDITVEHRGGAERVHFTQRLDWTLPDGDVVLQEQRTLAVYARDDLPATLVEWRSVLSVPVRERILAPAATLDGVEYHGLGVRFVQSMDEIGTFANASGAGGSGAEGAAATNNVRSPWCAYTAEAGGQPVTVVVFDHPRNTRHPATWFTMISPFSYITATLGLHNEPLIVRADRPLSLRYGVAVWDGRPDPVRIDGLYREWIRLSEAAAPQEQQS